MSKVPVAISASTIVPLTMFALAIVMSVGKAPEPNFVKATESFNNLEPFIFALAFISASTIVKSAILADVTIESLRSVSLTSCPEAS